MDGMKGYAGWRSVSFLARRRGINLLIFARGGYSSWKVYLRVWFLLAGSLYVSIAPQSIQAPVT